MRNTCAFTGHRPEKLPWRRGETDEGCKRLKRALYNQIVRYANAGVTDYLSGMAEGVDTWAAQSVLLLRRQSSSIRLHCILPCTARADLWSVSAQERYRSILEQADSIVYVRRNYTGDCMPLFYWRFTMGKRGAVQRPLCAMLESWGGRSGCWTRQQQP